jgi:hypothetical protein
MKRHHKTITAALFGIAFIAFPISAFAGKAVLNWNANTESDLAGYKIYYGTSARTGSHPTGGYTMGPIDAGNATAYTVNNLENGKKYYFSVTAYDTSNNESDFSGEVNKTIMSADVNNDHKVDIFDYNVFVGSFGNTTCGNDSDIDLNCKVDIFDYNTFLGDFGKTY